MREKIGNNVLLRCDLAGCTNWEIYVAYSAREASINVPRITGWSLHGKQAAICPECNHARALAPGRCITPMNRSGYVKP